jgi:uncharacterized protein YndB with AHSA1/START domain
MKMQPDKLEISARIQILKPAREVYEAIVDPAKMSNYFISKSSGNMEPGKTLQWEFPEFAGSFPVRIGTLVKDQYISFYWDDPDGTELLVEMKLDAKGDGKTVVSIKEAGRLNNEAGIDWLKRNTEGWANFLACLKAYLEYGINLRKGAFDFMPEK